MPCVDVETIYNHPNIIGVCRDLGGSEWEDIRNDVFLKVLEMSESERSKIKNLLAFMVMMCRNAAIDRLRKKKPILEPHLHEYKDEVFEDKKIRDIVLNDCNNPLIFQHARTFVYCNQYGSIKAFSKRTKIPYRELTKLYNEYREYLKSKLSH